MATPNCPRCGKTQFAVSSGQLVGRGLVNYEFVHCQDCGAVVHVIDLGVKAAIQKLSAPS